MIFACVVENVMQPSEAILLRIHERKGIVYHEQDSLNTLMANPDGERRYIC